MITGMVFGALVFSAGIWIGYVLRQESKTEIMLEQARLLADKHSGKLGNRIHRQRQIIRNLRDRLSAYEPKRDRREEFIARKSQSIHPNLPH